MRLGRRVLARVVVVVLLAGSLMAVIPGSAHADTLTPRSCHPIVSGDLVRRLDVCARGWVSTPDFLYTRGVVEMHTYAWVGGGANRWVDSRSQSITIERALVRGPEFLALDWGQLEGGNCRVNAPNGSTGCSVANVVAVDFYSPGILVTVGHDPYDNTVFTVSWRDDRGVPHRFVPVKVGPNDEPLRSEIWYAP